MGGSALFTFLASNSNVPFFGVGFTTFGMAIAGSLLGFAYGTPVKGWKRLFGYAAGGVFLGCWGVLTLPHILEWKWWFAAGPEIVAPPVAGFTALVSRWMIPFLVENMPMLWNRVFGHSRQHTGDK